MSNKKVTDLEKTARFFWEQWVRAVQVDTANKLSARPTYFWTEADKWVSAFKSSLSSKDLKSFDYYWKTWDDELDFYHNKATEKQRNKLDPMRVF